MIRGDLHLHTTNSDGTKSFQEVENIINNITGKKVASITDHHFLTHKIPFVDNDTLRIPGIEISANANGQSIHVTGYSIFPKISSDLQDILDSIVQGYMDRANRIYSNRLAAGMLPPPLSEFRDHHLPPPLYKSDFVRQLGKIIALENEKDIRSRAREHGNLLFSPEESFMPKIEKLIPAMHNSNFIACWAHPGKSLFRNSDEETISYDTLDAVISAGIDGIEPFAHKHTSEQTELFIDLARRKNLLVTGGSDYHGSDNHTISFPLDESYIKSFLDKIGYNGNFI